LINKFSASFDTLHIEESLDTSLMCVNAFTDSRRDNCNVQHK